MADVKILTSVGGGVFGASLVDELNRQGFPAELFSKIPLEDYWRKKGASSRLMLRAQMYGFYPLEAWTISRRLEKQLYLVTTNPFYLPLLISRSARTRGHRVVQWLYDLYPDALVVAGKLRSNGFLSNALAYLTRKSIRECEMTVFLGRRLANYAETTYGPPLRSTVIPVGSDSLPFEGARARLARTGPSIGDSALKILYSGHFGRMHDAVTISQALSRLATSNFHSPNGSFTGKLHLQFRANGPQLNWLKNQVKSDSGAGYVRLQEGLSMSLAWNLDFGGNLRSDSWAEMMQSIPIALVTMASGAEKVIMPSKTYSAMMAGQAILAVCPLQSDLADTVLEHDCGWVVTPEGCPDVSVVSDRFRSSIFHGADGFLRLVGQLICDPVAVHDKRMNSVKAGHENYSMRVVAQKWVQMFEELKNATVNYRSDPGAPLSSK